MPVFSCSGDPDVDPCPHHHEPTFQYTRFEGESNLTIAVTDAQDNTSSHTWSERVDRTPPIIRLSGDLPAADGQVVPAGSYDLAVDVEDDGPRGASGVKRMSLFVDDQLVAGWDNSQCSPTQCPNVWAKNWTYESAAYGDGLHAVRVEALDLLDHSTTDEVVIDSRHGDVLPSQTLDVQGQGGFRVFGAAGDLLGTSLTYPGDVNGDGFNDLLVGAPGASCGGLSGNGAAYLILGSNVASDVFVGDGSGSAIQFCGASTKSRAGYAVAAGGDLNGDGYADMLIGAPGAEDSTRLQGHVYALFGGPNIHSLLLSSQMSGAGFDIVGPLLDVPSPTDALAGNPPASLFGTQISTRPMDDDGIDGDVTGDGLDDIVIGQGASSSIGRVRNGAVWVIRGKADSSAVDLTTSPSTFAAGWRIVGPGGNSEAGQDTAIVGDIDDDGRGDIALTAPGVNSTGRSTAGTAYVVRGKDTGTEVDLNAVGSATMTVAGGSGYNLTNVAAGGDVDGDYVTDLLLGGYGAWVIYGAAGGTADLAGFNHQTQGYQISPPDSATAAQRADVANGSDQDGDGATDAIVTFAAANSGSAAGYLVYGRPLGGDVFLNSLGGNNGARLTGATAGYFGRAAEGSVFGPEDEPATAYGAPNSGEHGINSGSVRTVRSGQLAASSANAGSSRCAGPGLFRYPYSARKHGALLPCRRGARGTLDQTLAKASAMRGGRHPYKRNVRAFRAGNARVASRRFADEYSHPDTGALIPVRDSFNNAYAFIEQRKLGCFRIYDVNRVPRQDTVPVNGPTSCDQVHRPVMNIEFTGRACMASSAAEKSHYQFLLRETDSKGPSVFAASFGGFIADKYAPAALRGTSTSADLLRRANPGCGAKSKRLRPQGGDVKTAVSADDRFVPGDGYANRDQGRGPLENYQSNLEFASYRRLEISSTAVLGGGLIRATLPNGARLVQYDTMSRSDSNVCAKADEAANTDSDPGNDIERERVARWIYVDANPTLDSVNDQHVYGWYAYRLPDGRIRC